MQQYFDLEINVLSCLLIKPELMKEIKLEDKHFIKHKQLWQFMKAFYNKFGNFDLVLMFNVAKEKYQIVQYMTWLAEVEPSVHNFSYYQEQLINLYEQKKQEKTAINHIYSLANDLYVGNIDLDKFITTIYRIDEMYNIHD